MTSEWVKVEDPAELKAGMAVKHTPCGACSKTHVGNLMTARQVGEKMWGVTWPCFRAIPTPAFMLTSAWVSAGLLYRMVINDAPPNLEAMIDDLDVLEKQLAEALRRSVQTFESAARRR